MQGVESCPECGTIWEKGVTCTDHFHQALFWESEYPAYTLAVHHYLVLCYHLQHPRLYSREMLPDAVKLLGDFLNGATTEYIRERNRDVRDSGKRTTKITGTPDSYGEYAQPVRWTMTIADIVGDSVEHYDHNVRAWAQAIYNDLKESGNVPAA